MKPVAKPSLALPLPAETLAQIAQMIRTIRFGAIQITIHDSRVVQIEKVEKIRLPAEADRSFGSRKQKTALANRTTGGLNPPMVP